jgi:hypothetical protein
MAPLAVLLSLSGALVCGVAIVYVALRLVQSWRLDRARWRAARVAERLSIDEAATLGLEVTCRFVLRGTEHWDHAWTEITVRSREPELLPSIEIERSGPPGSFRIRAESGGRSTSVERALEGCASIEVRPRSKRARDADDAHVLVGDRVFDDAFVVSIAPRAVAAALLDERTQSALLSLHPVAVRQCAGGLLLEKPGYLEDRQQLAAAIGLVAAMTARAAEATSQLAAGTSYRGEGRVTGEARRSEMTTLLESMARRARDARLA